MAAIWLLLMGSAVVAVIMLRGQQRSVEATGAAADLRDRLALEAAIETVEADILFHGRSSQWAELPHRASIDVDGIEVSVDSSDERQRIDLNEVDLETLDTELRAMDVDPVERGAIAAEVQAKRAAGERFLSNAEIIRVLASAESDGARCLADRFTVFSGLQRPLRAEKASATSALAVEGDAAPTAALEPGAPLRLTVATPAGRRVSVLVRVTGLLANPITTLSWNDAAVCSP